MAAVNRIGADGNGYPHAGDSQVLDFMGDSLLDAGEADGVFHVTLSAAALARFRTRFPAWRNADEFELKI
ncbi:C-N hydrolase family amidase [compost metagenome]